MIYKFKSDGNRPKYFRDFQKPLELFKNLRDDDVIPKEVLKNEIKFISDLNKIKKEIQSLNQKSK